jgi:hypothetical protein
MSGISCYGKSAFCKVKESIDGGEYILNKKAKNIYSPNICHQNKKAKNICSPNICHQNKNVNSESNLLMLKKANTLKFNSFISKFNKSNLYINLYTKLDLKDVCTISNLSNNFPISITRDVPAINPVEPTFSNYVIDPSGNLFGNTPCGINNFVNYMVYNCPDSIAD